MDERQITCGFLKEIRGVRACQKITFPLLPLYGYSFIAGDVLEVDAKF